MKTIRYILFTILLSGLHTALSANDFEAALTSETAQLTFRSDSSLIGWGGADLGFGFFYNEADDFIGQLSILQARQASQKTPLTLGVGIKLYAGHLEIINKDILAMAIGGEVRYTIPGVMPKSIYFKAHYAPNITSFSGAEEVQDYVLGFQIEALPQTTAFVGVRHLEIDTESVGVYDADDDRIHVGIRLTF